MKTKKGSCMYKYLVLMFVTTTALANGALQDIDFATSAQITGAGGVVSQLLNSSKMYNNIDSEIMNTSIARWNAKLSSPVSLTTQVSGILPLANGGTNAALTAALGAIPYSTASAFAFLAPGTSGQVLTSQGGAAPIWSNASAGTVTSVALTVPNILSVAGSPITTSGTLAVSLATEAANLVFAGPTSGGAATPTFRALVAADIPSTFSYGQEVPSGTVDNSNVTFVLAHTPKANGAVSLYLDGLILNQGVDYTISSATITMTVAPNFNQKIYSTYQY